MLRPLVAAAVAVALLLIPASSPAAEVPAGAEWSEAYIESPDPLPNDEHPRLHADVLRPKGLAPTDRTPVVLTVSPYTNHSTQTGTDIDPTASGPSSRFFDFLADADLFNRGYTYVMVDLRGTGGSMGCNDWGGPGEQDDVKRAVEWAASQPWSTGKVALYGKSYDGWTGLMGLAQRPQGLAAVISQEPVVDGYRYLYMNGVRFSNSVGTPASFQLIDAAPGTINDSPDYQSQNVWANVVKPGCYATNYAEQQQDDPNSAFWTPRNLVPLVEDVSIPTFFMAGFLENNTKPDAIFSFWNNLSGPNRAWFGQWDHVRGNDRRGDGWATGRSTFIPEVLRFLDEHLKGVAGATAGDPPVVVQSNAGAFRGETQWPPADARALMTALRPGTYPDDGENDGDGSAAGNGRWTISAPLPYTVHLAGVPKLDVEVRAPARANLVGNLYDIAPDGKATLVSRGAYLLPGDGPVSFELYGEDWRFEAGHRLGVLLSGANAEWFVHVPTMADVEVTKASITLPFLTYARTDDLGGQSPARLEAVKARAFAVPADALAEDPAAFTLPPALSAPPKARGRGRHR